MDDGVICCGRSLNRRCFPFLVDFAPIVLVDLARRSAVWLLRPTLFLLFLGDFDFAVLRDFTLRGLLRRDDCGGPDGVSGVDGVDGALADLDRSRPPRPPRWPRFECLEVDFEDDLDWTVGIGNGGGEGDCSRCGVCDGVGSLWRSPRVSASSSSADALGVVMVISVS